MSSTRSNGRSLETSTLNMQLMVHHGLQLLVQLQSLALPLAHALVALAPSVTGKPPFATVD